jgi:hypothetical protein
MEECRRSVGQAVEAATRLSLAAGSADGKVFEHLSGTGMSYYTYAGELLQALWRRSNTSMLARRRQGWRKPVRCRREGTDLRRISLRTSAGS